MLYEIHLRRRTEEQTTDCATHEKQRRGIPHPSAHHHSISFFLPLPPPVDMT